MGKRFQAGENQRLVGIELTRVWRDECVRHQEAPDRSADVILRWAGQMM